MCLPVNQCCFCMSLQAGTKVIAVLSLMCSTATAVVYAGAAAVSPTTAQSRQCFYLLVAAIAACHVLFCSLLVYGAFWNKPSYLWPWLVTSWMSCASLVVLSLVGVVLLSIQFYDSIEAFDDISTMSTFYFVYAVILYYCAAVVQSRRLQMTRTEETVSADKLMAQQETPKTLLV